MSLLDSLVSYLELEEASGTRNDSHGTNHLADNNTVTQAAGKIGNAAHFTGANSEYLSIADNASLGFTTAFSVSFWVKITDKVTDAEFFRGLIAKWVDGSDAEWSIFQVDTGSSDDAYGISLATSAADNGAGCTFYATFDQFTAGTRHHVVIVYDGTLAAGSPSGVPPPNGTCLRLKAWRDGVNSNWLTTQSGTIPSTLRNGAAPLEIGRGTIGLLGSTTYFNGDMDEVALWSRAITADEVAALYNGGAGLAYPLGNATGTLAVTEGQDVAALAGVLDVFISGALAVTEGQDVAAVVCALDASWPILMGGGAATSWPTLTPGGLSATWPTVAPGTATAAWPTVTPGGPSVTWPDVTAAGATVPDWPVIT